MNKYQKKSYLCHPNIVVSMATSAWRTGGCVHVRGHCTIKREEAHALSVLQTINFVHEENDGVNQCVLARGGCTAPLLFFLEAMNDEIPVRGNKLATATLHETLPAILLHRSQTSGLAQTTQQIRALKHRIQLHSIG